MFSRTFEYTGYDGQPHKDTWYFNLTEAELYEMELGNVGGVQGSMERFLRRDKPAEIVKMFKGLILGAVGERSQDGRKFIKNDEIRDDFYQSKAYTILFTEMVQNGEAIRNFILGCIPDELAQKMRAQEAEEGNVPVQTQMELLPSSGADAK